MVSVGGRVELLLKGNWFKRELPLEVMLATGMLATGSKLGSKHRCDVIIVCGVVV
jgi:hypothetical protein